MLEDKPSTQPWFERYERAACMLQSPFSLPVDPDTTVR